METKLDNQAVGNMGLFFVCHHLSKLGWNVMVTARNARGVDVVIYSNDTSLKYTIQVKTLSKNSPVPLGKSVDKLLGDFFIICRGIRSDKPECFILKPEEVRLLAHRGEKNSNVSYWLQPKAYEAETFREKWDRIGVVN
jgi:hypothetical protein